MFKAVVAVTDHMAKVAAAARKAMLDRLYHGAAGVRKDAQASIENAPFASAPGTPPHSRRGLIRNAIAYFVDRTSLFAVIGPRGSRVGDAVAAHEFGGEFKGQEFPERPVMGPALEKRATQFAGDFAGTIGE